MALGRISGPLLKDNLLRNGINLAFENDLLYLLVDEASPTNYKVGIKTSSPSYDLDVNGTLRSTNLRATTLTVADLYIANATVKSQSGNLSLTANVNQSIVVGTALQNNDLLVNGNIHATGNITADGDITLGNDAGDTITIAAEIGSNLVPTDSGIYSLGTASLRWKDLYITGEVATGTLTGGNVSVSGNTIISTDTDGNIYLDPNGTGYVQINGTNGLVLPAGTTLEQAPSVTGAIRFNTTTTSFEGYNGGQWTSLGGVKSVDGKAYIIAETAPGAGDDTLHFWAIDSVGDSVNVGNWNGTALSVLTDFKINTDKFTVDYNTGDTVTAGDLAVNGGDITTTATTANVFNTNAITVNAFSEATAITIGADTGTATIKNASVVLNGDLTVNGGDIATTATTANVLNTDATTVNAFGAATAITIGSSTGTATIKNANVVLDGDLAVNGGDITTTYTGTVSIFDAAATVIDIGHEATNINIGSATTTVTIDGDLVVNGSNTTFNTTSIEVADGIIYLGTGNTANLIDLGFISHFDNGLYQHTGLVRDHTDGTWKLFSNAIAEVDTTVDFSGVVYDPLKIGQLTVIGNAVFDSTGAIQVPVGTTDERPVPVAGQVRLNSETGQFEGYSIGNWSSLGGVRSVDGKAYIIAETSPAAGDDTLHFYSGSDGVSGQVGTWDKVALTILSPGLLIPVGDTLTRPTGVNGYIRYNTDQGQFEGYASNNWSSLGGVKSVDGKTYIIPEAAPGASDNTLYFYANDTEVATLTETGFTVAGNITADTLNITGTVGISALEVDTLLVNSTISIHDNVIENIVDGQNLIIRAKGTGRVVLDGSGTSEGGGNVFATDPLLTLNTGVTGVNTYDTGIILNRGIDPNVGLVWSESAQEFRVISTLEQGTVLGSVAVAAYQNLSTASVKLTSETANKVTFTDSNKIVRSLDTGEIATVDGAMLFGTDSELAIPAGTQAQRPTAPTQGSIRYNNTTKSFEGYADSTWQSLGTGLGSPTSYQGFVGNGTTYQYTLNEVPVDASGLMVSVNGVLQEPGYSYQLETDQLIFTNGVDYFPPEVGDRVDVRFLSKPAVGSVQEFNYLADGNTSSFTTTNPISTKGEVLVFVNNIYQDSAVYSINGRQVIFDQAPYAEERITLVHLCSVFVSNIASPDDAIIYSIALG